MPPQSQGQRTILGDLRKIEKLISALKHCTFKARCKLRLQSILCFRNKLDKIEVQNRIKPLILRKITCAGLGPNPRAKGNTIM